MGNNNRNDTKVRSSETVNGRKESRRGRKEKWAREDRRVRLEKEMQTSGGRKRILKARGREE